MPHWIVNPGVGVVLRRRARISTLQTGASQVWKHLEAAYHLAKDSGYDYNVASVQARSTFNSRSRITSSQLSVKSCTNNGYVKISIFISYIFNYLHISASFFIILHHSSHISNIFPMKPSQNPLVHWSQAALGEYTGRTLMYRVEELSQKELQCLEPATREAPRANHRRKWSERSCSNFIQTKFLTWSMPRPRLRCQFRSQIC